MLERYLHTLTDELEEIEPPKKGDLGSYTLTLSSEREIVLGELNPGISFYTIIGPFPLVKREELLIHLMKANFLSQGTGGGTIGLEENEKFLTLSFVLPYDMNYKAFREALEDFVNYADYWKEELIRHSAQDQIFT